MNSTPFIFTFGIEARQPVALEPDGTLHCLPQTQEATQHHDESLQDQKTRPRSNPILTKATGPTQ